MTSRARPPRRRQAALLSAGLAMLAVLAAAGCSGNDGGPAPVESVKAQPPPTAFREGSCQVGAPDILALGRDADRLGDGPGLDEEVTRSLAETQERLAELAQGVEPELKPAFDNLVVSTGLVRIRAVGKGYERQLGVEMAKAYDDLVALCTGPVPSATGGSAT